jgi:hypothetical protein
MEATASAATAAGTQGDPDAASPPARPSGGSVSTSLVPTEPVDVARDPATDPVVDWQVRWTADGHAFGSWVAGRVGADVGTLTVRAIDDAGRIVQDQTLLGPTAAKRSFTLGLDRAAFVAPTDAGNAELRVATWGPSGKGILRIADSDQGEGLPGF